MALALVTGGSVGIGFEIARELGRRKHDVILTARNQEALEKAAMAIRNEFGVTCHILTEDLAKHGAARNVWENAGKIGEIEILVNNAGFGGLGRFDQTDLDNELRMIQLNVTALTELFKHAVRAMVAKKKGYILNVASTAAFQPGPLMAVYYATKAYVLSLSEAVAFEVRGTGVSVTALCPGPTRTGFQDAAGIAFTPLVQMFPLPTAEGVARRGVRAMFRGQRVVIPGLINKLFSISVRLSPRSLILAFIWFLQKDKRKPSHSI